MQANAMMINFYEGKATLVEFRFELTHSSHFKLQVPRSADYISQNNQC